MQRHELIKTLRELKLYGRVEAYDEAVVKGIHRKHTVEEIFAVLCRAEAAERKARSIRYQMGISRFPVQKDLDSFVFADAVVEERHIRELYTGSFLDDARNLIFIGGTGTGKTHLAIAAHCIRVGRRGRFFSVVNLVNQLSRKNIEAKQEAWQISCRMWIWSFWRGRGRLEKIVPLLRLPPF